MLILSDILETIMTLCQYEMTICRLIFCLLVRHTGCNCIYEFNLK